MNRHTTGALLLALAFALAACGGRDAPAAERDGEAYATRGIFYGLRYEGQAVSVEHEEVPGFMGAMRMDLFVLDPAEVDGLEPGDPVAFEMVVTERGVRARNFERLPDTTRLDVPSTRAEQEGL